MVNLSAGRPCLPQTNETMDAQDYQLYTESEDLDL